MLTLVSNHLPLVELLKDRFQPKNITPSSSLEDIMFTAGQQSVLEFLDAQLEEEESQQLQFK